MRFSNLFREPVKEEPAREEVNEPLPEGKREGDGGKSDPSKKESSIDRPEPLRRAGWVDPFESAKRPVIGEMAGSKYIYSDPPGTNLPIDLIYTFLQGDFARKGYEDAVATPDQAYKEISLEMIRSELEVKFKQVLLVYEGMLQRVEFNIQLRGETGLFESMEQLKAEKEIYVKHVEAIKTMKQDLDNKELYMLGVFKSYEVGFLRGLSSLSLHSLKVNVL
jgi:hypothetical protein